MGNDVFSDKARDYLIEALDRATPFKGVVEMGTDLAGPFIVDQFAKHVIERYVEEGYHDEVNRFVEALEEEDLVAAEQELRFFAQGNITLPFLKSGDANLSFITGVTNLMLAAVQEIKFRIEHKIDDE